MTSGLKGREGRVVRGRAKTRTRVLPARSGEVRTEMQRALFEDVRPGWEEYLATRQPESGARRLPEQGSSFELLVGVFRATFDDVRPRWEAYYAREEHKLAA